MGGATISFINMLSNLKRLGIIAYIIHPDITIDKDFQEKTKGLIEKTYYIPLHPQVYGSRSDGFSYILKSYTKKILNINKIWLSKDVDAVLSIARNIQPDIIHTNSGVHHCGYFVAKELNIPHIWHIREYQTKDFAWEIYPSKETFEKYLSDSYVVTITKDLLAYFHLNKSKKARCIYNGCFNEKDISFCYPKGRYFLMCSRISWEKGHDDVIRAFSKVYNKHQDYKLLIAGFGDKKYIAQLKQLSRKLGCDLGVEFLGYQKDVTFLMDNARALIVASKFEGFGRMTAEAAFRGCITIGRATGGTKEILEQIGGFMYLDEVDELVKQMEQIIVLNDDEYKRIAETAQIQAIRLFSNEQMSNNLFDFYTKIIK